METDVNFKVNEKILAKYIKKNPDKAKYILKMYMNYSKVLKLIKSEDMSILKTLEDKVYTVGGKVLGDKERLDLELINILSKISKSSNDGFDSELYKDVLNIKADFNNDTSELKVEYLKKQLSVIQAKLGMDMTFFQSSYNAFLEVYYNIVISLVNLNRDNKTNYKKPKEIK